MKFIASFIALVSLVAAAPQASTSLDVKLQMAGNSAVRATITNNGKTNLRIFKTGTILDRSPVQKAHITRNDGKFNVLPSPKPLTYPYEKYQQIMREHKSLKYEKSLGNKVRFHGIRQRITTQNLDDAAFEPIPAGKSVEVVFDVGQVHDLSSGGTVDIHSSGVMYFANEDNNEVAGSVPYTSNVVRTEIDGDKAASVLKSFHADRRSTVQDDCVGSWLSDSQSDLSECVRIAKMAQSAAQSNNKKVMEYFKDTSDGTKAEIASVYDKVATECGAGNGGKSKFFCSDIESSCTDGVVAYTMGLEGNLVYCNLFFTLPILTHECHKQDQATTVVHEMTHLLAATSDLAYGYDAIMKLDTASALNNAESYSLFVNAIVAGC
ncbi:hypothetical protein E4U55_005782 [Claviceps digitariae]|nr:hypothetical protein E4U55_005782 [Claviceps digitariae]